MKITSLSPQIGRLRSRGRGSCRSFLKRLKARSERRRARRDPECLPAYVRYTGWLD